MDATTFDDLKTILDRESDRINSPGFIDADPVQFPRQFSDPRDIEIASLLCSTIAWGNRKMICRDCSRLLATMENAPYRFMAEGGFEELNDADNVHRTFFIRNLKHYLRGLQTIYQKHGTLQDFAVACGAPQSEFPAWVLAEGIATHITNANGGEPDSRCLPINIADTALKRLNMALRWLVRKDGIVDMGIWDAITPAQLYIPLDVHVGNVARHLGMLTRKANDRKSTVELTSTLRKFDPTDPVRYDYALFGLGIEGAIGKELPRM